MLEEAQQTPDAAASAGAPAEARVREEPVALAEGEAV
jgi:hypothetical protein